MTATFEERFSKLGEGKKKSSFEDRFNQLSKKGNEPEKEQVQSSPLSFEDRFNSLANPIIAESTSQVSDYFQPLQPKPFEKEPVYAEEKTAEELKKMSVSDRLQYAKDLATEREFRQSKGFTKGALSGATLGLSEKIPELEPKEGEFLSGFGEFLGAALPISKLYNYLGKPLINLAAKSPIAKMGLESLARMTGMGLTGAAYEGAKEKVKTGEAPSAEELAKYGASWAAFDGALQLVGKAASFLPKLKGFAESNKIPEKEALTQVIDELANEGINPLEAPEEAIGVAEEFLERSNAEIRVSSKPLTVEKIEPLLEKEVEPIIEMTGRGAAEQIEYPKGSFGKLIEKTNQFIQAAKSPADSLKRLGRAANEGIFNALAPLERLETDLPIPERASTHIKLAQSAASEINSVLENGIFSNLTGRFEHEGLKGAYGDLTWKKFSKNLKEGEYSLQDLDAYRTSKIALKRQLEGKKTGIDTHKAREDIARLSKKYEPIDRSIRDFQKATIKHYGKDLLGEEMIEKWNKEYYSPLYRVMESGKDSILKSGALTPKQPFKKMTGSQRKIIPPSESDPYNASMLISNSRKNEAILQYRKLVEKGHLPGKIKVSKNEPIPQEVLDELDINPDFKDVAETLYNQTRLSAYTPEKNVLRGWKGGKPFSIEVPEDIYNVFSSIAPQERGPLAKMFSATNRLFSKGISMAPRKFGSIFGRDALSSLVYSRTGSNPISIPEALSDIFGAKPVYKEFLAMGGDVYASRLAERIDRTKKIEELITPGKEGMLVPFEQMGQFFKQYSNKLGDISMAVPLAEYKRALAKYGNTAEGRIMAAMEARRVTYDPTRKGNYKIVRELGNFIPFWNVSLQDMASLGRNLKEPSAWVKGMTAITLPTLYLKMINEGNPDYEDLTPVDKAAFWHVYYGDNHIRIPIPWLLGTTFKVGAEAFYEQVQDMRLKRDPRAKEAWQALYENFVENLSGDLPPLLTNYIEMTQGRTVPSPLGVFLRTESRAPDVIPRRLQDLPPSLQYTSKTSQLARKFGQLWGISPVKLERTIKNFGTQVASDVLALTDEIAYATGLAEDKRPEQRESNYLLLGNFVSNSPPSRTKYMNEFYDYLHEAEQNKKGMKIIHEKGLEESLEELDYKNVPLSKFQREISKLFNYMRSVEDDSSMKPKEKKQELDSTQRKINDLYKRAVELVHEAKKSH